MEGQVVQNMLNERCTKLERLKDAEGWCDSIRTFEGVKAKIQISQEGAFKRESTCILSSSEAAMQANFKH
ncbi:unnamed protein product [Lathyrus oleraceus]